jgi:hypothetical protein
MAPPVRVRSFSLLGWGLNDLPLRASNEGLLRPRVARAQKIIRLHPHPASTLTTQRLPPYDAGAMSRNESGNVNLAAIVLILGIVIASVWIWKRLSVETQDYFIDEMIPLVVAGVLVLVALWLVVRAVKKRKHRLRRRAQLIAAFERETARDKKLEMAFVLIELNEYRVHGLESVVPAMRELFVTTLQRALGEKQHRIRGMAASHLGVLRDMTVVPLLVKALEDDHAYVRSCAALGLGRLQATETRERLQTIMKEDWDQTVRSRAKEALEQMKGQD